MEVITFIIGILIGMGIGFFATLKSIENYGNDIKESKEE